MVPNCIGGSHRVSLPYTVVLNIIIVIIVIFRWNRVTEVRTNTTACVIADTVAFDAIDNVLNAMCTNAADDKMFPFF